MKTQHHTQKGFSLIELVVVIVIAGILFSLPRLRFTYDLHSQAVLTITQGIYHTQYLAMMDQKEDNTSNYSVSWWRVMFHKDNSGNAHQVLSVWSNKNKTGSLPASDEVAVDPLTQLYMSGNSQFNSKKTTNQLSKYDLTQSYSVEVTLQGDQCTGKNSIYFDHYGRPHVGSGVENNPNKTLLITPCTIFIKSTKQYQTTSLTLFPYTGLLQKD